MSIPLIIVTHAKNPNLTGVVVDHFVNQVVKQDPTTGEQTIEAVPTLAVCWEQKRTPAIHYHHPSELVWEDIPDLVDEDVDDEEDDEDDDYRAAGASAEAAL